MPSSLAAPNDKVNEMEDVDLQLAEQMRQRVNDAGRGLSGFYDRQGLPIGLGDLLVLKMDENYSRIAFDQVGEVEISTVWLGHDEGCGQGALRLFETMVFALGGRAVLRTHYATEAAARLGHDEIVRKARDELL